MSYHSDMVGPSRQLYNPKGDLILPSGAVEEFRRERKKARRIYTGKMATCPKCGHEWEICGGKRNMRRCHSCGARVYVDVQP